jgi:hypothetical protein
MQVDQHAHREDHVDPAVAQQGGQLVEVARQAVAADTLLPREALEWR